MNRAIIIEDWILEKEYLPKPVWTQELGSAGRYVGDFETAQKCFRVVGTKEQIKAWSAAQDFMLDEVYSYEPIEKNGYWYGICCHDSPSSPLPTRKQYNEKFEEDYLRYLKMYKDNYSKVLILRTA